MTSLQSLFDKMVDLFGHLVEPPMIYWVVAGLVILIILWMWYAYRRNTRGIIPFRTQGGTIEIAPGTLRGVMQNAANSVKGVERATCRHFIKGRRVGVKVAIHLRANNRLKDVDAQIKKCIRNTLFEQFGMESIDPIHIRVTRIVGDPVAAPADPEMDESMERQSGLLDDDSDERDYADETRL